MHNAYNTGEHAVSPMEVEMATASTYCAYPWQTASLHSQDGWISREGNLKWSSMSQLSRTTESQNDNIAMDTDEN